MTHIVFALLWHGSLNMFELYNYNYLQSLEPVNLSYPNWNNMFMMIILENIVFIQNIVFSNLGVWRLLNT